MLVTREGDGGSGEERSVYESLICNEYLEDAYPDKMPLLPAHPADRAHARIVMDRFNSRCMPQFYRFLVRQARLSSIATLRAITNASIPSRHLEHSQDRCT